MKIKKMFEEIKKLRDCEDPNQFLDLLKVDTFDIGKIDPELGNEVDKLAKAFDVRKRFIFNGMLAILAAGSGRCLRLRVPGFNVWPNLFVLNVMRSAKSKTPPMNWLMEPTVRKRTKKMLQAFDEGMPTGTGKGVDQLRSDYLKSKKTLLLNDSTPEMLVQHLRNSSLLAYWDEISLFFAKTKYNPERPDTYATSDIPIFLQLHGDHSYTVSRLGDAQRDVFDASLSKYLHGTPDQCKELFSQKLRKIGVSWRYLTCVPDDKEETKSLDYYMSMPSAPFPKKFVEIFDHLFDHLFDPNAGGNISLDTPLTYELSSEAYEIWKEFNASMKYIGDVMDSEEENWSMRSTMVLKVPGYVDKFALLFQLIRDHDTVFGGVDKLFAKAPVISAETMELACEYGLLVYQNWMEMITLVDIDQNKEEILIKENKNKDNKYVKVIKMLANTKLNASKGDSVSIKEMIEILKNFYPEKNKSKFVQRLIKNLESFPKHPTETNNIIIP